MKRRDLLIGGGLLLGTGAAVAVNRDRLLGQNIDAPDELNIAVFNDLTPQRYIRDNKLLEYRFGDTKISYTDAISGPNVVALMEREAVDIATIGSVPATIALTRRLPYKIVQVSRVAGTSEALATKEEITGASDLIGRRVAVTRTSTAHFSLVSWFNKISIPYCDGGQCGDDKVGIVYAEPDEIVKLWDNEQIFGAFTWYSFLDRIKAAGGVIVLDSADLRRKGVIVCDVVMMRDSLLRRYPELCKYYLDTSKGIVDNFSADPNGIVRGFSNPDGKEPSEILQSIKNNPWLTAEEQSSLAYFGTQNNPGAFVELLQGYALFLAKEGVLNESDVRNKGAIFYRRGVVRL